MARVTKDNESGDASTNGARSSAPTESRKTADAEAPAGRIVHDERGNAVWKWANGNGRTATGSTSRMLKQLDVTELRVEDEQPSSPSSASGPDVKRRGSGYGPGYNPYDRTAPVRVAPPPKKPKR